MVTSGVYDGDLFVFGGLADENGELGQGPTASQGSDFMIETIEFAFGTIVAPTFAPNALNALDTSEAKSIDNMPLIEEVDTMILGVAPQDEDFSIL